VALTMLVMSMHVSLPPGDVTPMFLVLGPLQGSHKSAHFDCLIAYFLRPMP
jgi:hypothetical protein